MAPVPAFTEDDLEDHYDEFDDEDANDGLSPEDRAALIDGTAAVQKALGSDAQKVTTAQIQEALWYYYYDVSKSVGYLRKTFISPKPKPETGKSVEGESITSFPHNTLPRAAIASLAKKHDANRTTSGGARTDESFLPQRSSSSRMPQESICGASSDMPRLAPPGPNQSDLKPANPVKGLSRSGNGPLKMSKLQALAAARKKSSADRQTQEITSDAENGMKRMSLADSATKNDRSSLSSIVKKQRGTDGPIARLFSRGHESDSSQASAKARSTSPVLMEEKNESHGESDAAEMNASGKCFEAASSMAPSPFARTLFTPLPHVPKDKRPDLFPSLYAHSPITAFSEPSPDDVVLAAQAKAKKPIPSSKGQKKKPAETLGKESSRSNQKPVDRAVDLSALKISDGPPPKSKGLNVIEEYEKSERKKNLSFVVVGHVDAGKSTLMGRLLLELKKVEQRTVDKYQRQAEKAGKTSFALAWVLDQGSEERERGVTIDVATNHFETSTKKFTILDAPGHRDFVPNMIAGASQADLAVLVIDANTGAYEKGLKGQAREHVLLLRSLGVQRIIVAVNKLDMVGWSQDRFDEISGQVSGFLTGLGFQSRHVSFIPISGLNGDNIASKLNKQAAPWYEGLCLLDALEATEPTTMPTLKKPFRMSIFEIYRSQQGTTTLAGRVDAGTTQLGSRLIVQPSGESAFVKSLMVDTEPQDWAVAGQSISMALTNIDPVHIRVGDIICDAEQPIQCGDSFVMKSMAFEHIMPMPVDLHRGRLHAPGQIVAISALLDKSTGAILKKKPKIVQPGGVARLMIKLDARLPLEAGQRVVLRSGGETIAAGLLE